MLDPQRAEFLRLGFQMRDKGVEWDTSINEVCGDGYEW